MCLGVYWLASFLVIKILFNKNSSLRAETQIRTGAAASSRFFNFFRVTLVNSAVNTRLVHNFGGAFSLRSLFGSFGSSVATGDPKLRFSVSAINPSITLMICDPRIMISQRWR
jgi:hypothetical protein